MEGEREGRGPAYLSGGKPELARQSRHELRAHRLAPLPLRSGALVGVALAVGVVEGGGGARGLVGLGVRRSRARSGIEGHLMRDTVVTEC